MLEMDAVVVAVFAAAVVVVSTYNHQYHVVVYVLVEDGEVIVDVQQ